jgi:DNA-binding NarL/FixJ family response regulator
MNVVIADQQAIFRTGIAQVLAAEDDIRIVGQPQFIGQLLNILERFPVHLLLIAAGFSPALPEIQSLATRRSTAVLGLAEVSEEASAFMALGVRGVVYRSVKPATFLDAVRRLARGETFVHTPDACTTEVGEDVAGCRVRGRLSPTELRIVGAVARGYKNHEIAMLLHISDQTVKNGLSRIFDKVGVSDRLELVLYMLHHASLELATAAAWFKPDTRIAKTLEAPCSLSSGAPGTYRLPRFEEQA